MAIGKLLPGQFKLVLMTWQKPSKR